MQVSGQSSKSSTKNGTRSATVLERVVGTLDLSVRQLSQGETFPGVGGAYNLPFFYPKICRTENVAFVEEQNAVKSPV